MAIEELRSVRYRRLFLVLALFTLLSLPFTLAEENELTYDAVSKNVTIDYDGLNRPTAKSSLTQSTNYTYDEDYYGTLSNVTTDNVTVEFEYDDQLRVIKEKRLIDGITFEKSYIYDAKGQLISVEVVGQDIDYIHNSLGNLESIPGYIASSSYSAFGSILNRTYDNGLVQSYTYDSENNRLTSIAIPSVQNLAYTYDAVGNILAINDSILNLNHALSYDKLDRLVEATIGSDRYVYSYNPIGNMMKIVTNNESKKFVYDGNQAHAPSSIVDGAAGADVYNIKDLDTQTRNRTYEFFIVNDANESLSDAAFEIDFGDGNSFSDSDLTVGESLWVITEHAYTSGGDYAVKVNASSAGVSDRENMSAKFGTRAMSLLNNVSDVSEKVFAFTIANDLTEQITGVSWNCSDGSSGGPTTIAGSSSLAVQVEHNYSTPGDKSLQCTVTSGDGTESKTLDFGIPGLDVEDFDALSTDVSYKLVSYTVMNEFELANVSIDTDIESAIFTADTTLATNESIMMFAEVNYSSDGVHNFSINFSAENEQDEYVHTFDLQGVSIENYERTPTNYTTNLIKFDIRNAWYEGDVNWTVNDPDFANTTTISQGATETIEIETDYAGESTSRTEATATISSFIDLLKNAFEIKPLEILSYVTLAEGESSVSEVVVNNNLNTSQTFDWTFETGSENISSSQSTSISTDDTFIYIESNHSTLGVFPTLAYVNSTAYNDSQEGVIVR